MFKTAKWDSDASSESLYSHWFESHSRNGRKRHKKSQKGTKTKRIIKEQFFPTQVNQDIHTPVSNVARSKTKKVKPNLMSLPTTGTKIQNVERRKIKNTGEKKKYLSCSKKQSQSYDEERKTCNLEVSDANLVSKRKRRRSVSSHSGSVQYKKKKRKTSSQIDPLLPGSNISNMPACSENKELTKGNWKHQNQKKSKKSMNSKTENSERPGSTSPSPYSIHKLKQMIEASNAKELKKEIITERKKVKETGSLRERMLKRLQASRFRYLNEQLYTSDGKDAKEYFEGEPEAFDAYHEGYQQQVQQWPINPLDIIITALKKKSSELVVADFGCGDAHLAQSIPNKVHSFDLVAKSKEVTACNMAHTPLSNASVDVVVFCLSLMGTNLSAYLTEANRVLKEGGLLKIAEVESRFEDVQAFIQNLGKFGFVNTWKDLSHSLFYFMDFKKEKSISKKMKKKLPEITLKPCLYKKR